MSDVSLYFDKSLYATSSVLGYNLPDISSSVVYTFKSGDYIGVIDSFVSDNYNNHYFVIYPGNDTTGTPFYILIDPYSLKVPSVSGNISDINFTIPLPVAVDSTQPFSVENVFQSLLSNIEKIIPIVIIAIVAINVIPTLIKKEK
jgi:hypothetical protein